MLSRDFSAVVATPQGSSREARRGATLHLAAAHSWNVQQAWVRTSESNSTQHGGEWGHRIIHLVKLLVPFLAWLCPRLTGKPSQARPWGKQWPQAPPSGEFGGVFLGGGKGKRVC